MKIKKLKTMLFIQATCDSVEEKSLSLPCSFFFFDSGNPHDSIDHRIDTHPQDTNFAVMFW